MGDACGRICPCPQRQGEISARRFIHVSFQPSSWERGQRVVGWRAGVVALVGETLKGPQGGTTHGGGCGNTFDHRLHLMQVSLGVSSWGHCCSHGGWGTWKHPQAHVSPLESPDKSHRTLSLSAKISLVFGVFLTLPGNLEV